jgi:hypothetical protein
MDELPSIQNKTSAMGWLYSAMGWIDFGLKWLAICKTS